MLPLAPAPENLLLLLQPPVCKSEANSRLGFSARTTMNAAQALYQAGLITYHRTDSLNLSKQAIAMTASYIEENFGKEYLKIRNFKTKSAGAQEAHEAIRPPISNKKLPEKLITNVNFIV